MPLVKVTYEDDDLWRGGYVEADTIKELKEKISTELSKGLGEDRIEVGEKWRLFQLAFLLPNAPETKLEDFKDEDGKIQLNLVRPESMTRGKSMTIDNQTGMDRFIVLGGKINFKVIHIPRNKSRNVKAPLLYHTEKFGVATNNYTDGSQRVHFDCYIAKQRGQVEIKLPSPFNPESASQDDYEVWLKTENSANPVKLDVDQAKTFNEKDIVRLKDVLSLIFGGVSVCLAGISAGNDIGEMYGAETEADNQS